MIILFHLAQVAIIVGCAILFFCGAFALIDRPDPESQHQQYFPQHERKPQLEQRVRGKHRTNN